MNKYMVLMVSSIFFSISTQNANKPQYHFADSTESSALKILSWNIYMLPFISLINNNDERATLIADKLNASDYQIIVFQEAFSSKCRHILAKKLSINYPFQYGPANKNRFPLRTNSGLWVVSKIPLTEVNQIQFSVSKGFDAVARKGAVLFEGCYRGNVFQLLATHLQADHDDAIRKQQCVEIKEHLLDQYARENIPQFICGDFNIDRYDTPNYRQMLQSLDAKNGEFTGNIQVTYDELYNNLAYKAEGKRRMIDYVLVRNSTFIVKMERKVKIFFSNISALNCLSDHYAIEFSVNFADTLDRINTNDQLMSLR